MKYQQFQPSTVLFIVGYPCNYLYKHSVHLLVVKTDQQGAFYLRNFNIYCCRFRLLCHKGDFRVQENTEHQSLQDQQNEKMINKMYSANEIYLVDDSVYIC